MELGGRGEGGDAYNWNKREVREGGEGRGWPEGALLTGIEKNCFISLCCMVFIIEPKRLGSSKN